MRRSDQPQRVVSRMLDEYGQPIEPRRRRSFLFRLVRARFVLGIFGGRIAGGGLRAMTVRGLTDILGGLPENVLHGFGKPPKPSRPRRSRGRLTGTCCGS